MNPESAKFSVLTCQDKNKHCLLDGFAKADGFFAWNVKELLKNDAYSSFPYNTPISKNGSNPMRITSRVMKTRCTLYGASTVSFTPVDSLRYMAMTGLK